MVYLLNLISTLENYCNYSLKNSKDESLSDIELISNGHFMLNSGKSEIILPLLDTLD